MPCTVVEKDGSFTLGYASLDPASASASIAMSAFDDHAGANVTALPPVSGSEDRRQGDDTADEPSVTHHEVTRASDRLPTPPPHDSPPIQPLVVHQAVSIRAGEASPSGSRASRQRSSSPYIRMVLRHGDGREPAINPQGVSYNPEVPAEAAAPSHQAPPSDRDGNGIEHNYLLNNSPSPHPQRPPPARRSFKDSGYDERPNDAAINDRPPADNSNFRASYGNGLTDWIVSRRNRTVLDRLQPTITEAREEKDRAERTAKFFTYSLNIAASMQIIVGALTTGIGAALRGDSVHIAIALLGGMSTILASYLARARFSNEPESSLLRAETLKQFLREVNTFIIDYGDDLGSRHDEPIKGYRTAFANLMGQSSAQSERFEDMKNGSVANESIRPTAHRSLSARGLRDPVSFA